jgi:ribonuclease P protein subunit POP4
LGDSKFVSLCLTRIGQGARINLNSSTPFIPTYVTSHLQTSDPGCMYANRVQGRQIALENPARESRAKKALADKKLRQKAEKERKRKGLLSKREAKEKGVWRLDETQAKWVLDQALLCDGY